MIVSTPYNTTCSIQISSSQHKQPAAGRNSNRQGYNAETHAKSQGIPEVVHDLGSHTQHRLLELLAAYGNSATCKSTKHVHLVWGSPLSSVDILDLKMGDSDAGHKHVSVWHRILGNGRICLCFERKPYCETKFRYIRVSNISFYEPS